MTDIDAHLTRAGRLLGDCSLFFAEDAGLDRVPALLDEARALYDDVPPGDPVRDATVAVGRSVLATTALRLLLDGHPGLGWDFDEEGPMLCGLGDWDDEEVSRPLTEEAVRMARAAFNASPEDPLVPMHLGMTLTWLGDGDGAAAAYREALRRDPTDELAVECLQGLGEEAAVGEARERSHAFALLLDERRVSNSGWISDHRVFPGVPAARRAAEEIVRDYDGGDVLREELPSRLDLTLETHRPGAAVITLDVVAMVAPGDGPFRVRWPDAPDPASASALVAGRIMRLGGRNWFPG